MSRLADILSRPFAPADEYRLTGRLFLKLLALIYFAAFFSLQGQILGLVGSGGIVPVSDLVQTTRSNFGDLGWLYVPTIFWLIDADWAIQAAAQLGCLFAVTLFLGIWPRMSLIALFVLYLSLTRAGQVFLNFQWDYLLLETGFLSIFLVGGPNRLLVFLFHWLLFRLRFMSGISKLASGDPSWSGFTALRTYFETQPLPHAGAWYAHQLPDWLLQAGVGLTFFAELIVPFFIFLPRRFRLFAAGVTLLIQLIIIATSNHNFINLLTILLCLFLLDDKIVAKVYSPGSKQSDNGNGFFKGLFTAVAALLILSSSLPLLLQMSAPVRLPERVEYWTALVRNYGIGSAFHVFPTMQTERIELRIEASNDGKNWRPYIFKWKPGSVDERPAFIVPHQPRLDWMIWFVPSQHPMNAIWFNNFMNALAEARPQVTELLRSTPFGDSKPKYLRVSAYRYHFTTFEEREATGNWWKREYIGQFPAIPPRNP